MTVAELIAALQQLDPELPVCLESETEDGCPTWELIAVARTEMLALPLSHGLREPVCMLTGGAQR